MGQDHGHRLAEDRGFHDLAHREVHRVHVALGDLLALYDLPSGIEAEDAHAFIRLVAVHRAAGFPGIQGASDIAELFALFLVVAVLNALDEGEQRGRRFLHPRHIRMQDLVIAGVQHIRQTSEMRDQLFGLVFGIPVRNRKLQQQLKHLIVLKAVHAVLKIALSQPLAVPLHLLFLFRIRLRNAAVRFFRLFFLSHGAHLRSCSSVTHPCWRRR